MAEAQGLNPGQCQFESDPAHQPPTKIAETLKWQVPLAAQIEKVRREIGYAQEGQHKKAERLWSAVLDSLQQYERLR